MAKPITYKTTNKCLADNRTAKYEACRTCRKSAPFGPTNFKNSASKKKQYETKRERNFHENWADEFPGVRHAVPLDEEGNIDESTPKLSKVMFCQTRKAYPIKTNC